MSVRVIKRLQMHWNATGMYRIQRNSTEFNPNSLLYMGFVSFAGDTGITNEWLLRYQRSAGLPVTSATNVHSGITK